MQRDFEYSNPSGRIISQIKFNVKFQGFLTKLMSANGSSICASAWCTLEIVLHLLRRQCWVSGSDLSEDYTDTGGLFLSVLYKSLNLTAYISHHAKLD